MTDHLLPVLVVADLGGEGGRDAEPAQPDGDVERRPADVGDLRPVRRHDDVDEGLADHQDPLAVGRSHGTGA
ncbi:hypothetical protein [Nocardioides sp. TF02-7]|uniref:hypothetical protein n=1 Tax=Nocardioides sp. TF02-7 TaxID=2917724 RepID=UPI0023DA5562|nr:hypothetical protein [Nocardioides sp. TF02-7]